MRLIVAGSTGFVGTEVIRQALSIPVITSIVAGGRCLYLVLYPPVCDMYACSLVPGRLDVLTLRGG